jgi:hypothetical protein
MTYTVRTFRIPNQHSEIFVTFCTRILRLLPLVFNSVQRSVLETGSLSVFRLNGEEPTRMGPLGRINLSQ